MTGAAESGAGATPTRDNIDVVSWDDLADVAARIFAVWPDSTPERAWARRAWGILEEAGLAGYTFEVERTVVCLRFLTLGHLYHDWCSLAFEEGDSDFIANAREHADELSVDRFYVGQLIGRDFVPEDDDSTLSAYDEAVSELVRIQRRQVVQALLAGIGGEAQMFVSLWRTRPVGRGGGDSDDPKPVESDDEILNGCVTPEKVMAYEWVARHCPPR